MKGKWFCLVSVALLFIFILGGCTPATPVTCPTADLQAVSLSSPAMWEVVDSLSPTLNWTYPDPGCNPQGYRIELRTGPDYTDDLSGGTGNPSTSWSPASPLVPAHVYEWAVSPVNGSTLGPIAGYHYFFTGPQCATEALKAPALLDPPDGAEVHALDGSLSWRYLDPCLPHGYRVDLSTDPTFTDTSLSGGTGRPLTRWFPGQPLADCTTYFWRIAPINDYTLGPFSSVFSFHTDVNGNCAPEAAATVFGILWYDECPLALNTNPVPNPLPAGCAVDLYGVDADAIHEPGEPFMGGITVNLGPGDCPSGGPMSIVTDSTGQYKFSGLVPGKYCLNVNAASFSGPDASGHWTLLPGGHEGNTYRAILLSAGQTLVGQDFAWYQNGGGPTLTPTAAQTAPPKPSLTPTTVPDLSFTPDNNLYCHSGPGIIYDSLDVALKGQRYLIDGRNLEKDWLRIMLTPAKGCWVLANMGTATGDISAARVLISPPTPTPTVVMDCATYTDEKSCEAQPVCQWKLVPAAVAAIYACTAK